jgi:hypothetical protein
VLSVDSVQKKDGRRLDRFHFMICTIAMQLQLQFIIHIILLSSVFHIYTHAFRSLLCVVYALPTVQDTSTHKCCLRHHRYNAVADDSWRKCRLLYHGYNAIADNSWAGRHLVPRILHWVLTEKVEKGQILWVHTYPTTSSRPRERCVQSLVHIGSEMWICISSIHTYKQTNKQTNIHIYI